MAEVQKDTLGSREDTLRFLDVVALFGQQAMISLGKLVNPMTSKAEKNLLAARLFIDTLEMLERKTQGNLNSDESKVLQATLTDLRLMFVEESKAPAVEKPKTEPKEEPAKTEPQETDESKVKFHKKYD
ncbi:MAG TPA: DUF1844 domain-containing protein [Verrucomicrobiae bacterium]|nr:DUF1844 domain-containing protein [Verrucomicrobiae bacterium]